MSYLKETDIVQNTEVLWKLWGRTWTAKESSRASTGPCSDQEGWVSRGLELGLGEPPELGLPGSRLHRSGLCTKLFLQRSWDCVWGTLCERGQEVIQLKLLGSKLPLLPLLGLHRQLLGCPPWSSGQGMGGPALNSMPDLFSRAHSKSSDQHCNSLALFTLMHERLMAF